MKDTRTSERIIASAHFHEKVCHGSGGCGGGGDVANELAHGKAMFKAVIALKERTLQE